MKLFGLGCRPPIWATATLSMLLFCSGCKHLQLWFAPRAPEPIVVQDQPDMQWWRDSMKTRDQRLTWFTEARFGMFIHWGVYAVAGGVWQGEPFKGYAEHIQRIKRIPVSVYKKRLAAKFNPTEFDADTWVQIAKAAGMRYMVITAKHHDGLAMYDSAVSDYSVAKVSPWKNDPMAALKAACDKHGLRFGFYYSHARDWADGPVEDWDKSKPKHDAEKRMRTYVSEKAIPQVLELIAKYDPDLMWFDTPRLPLEENLRILKAARTAKPTLVVNGRIAPSTPNGPPARFGDYVSTTDKPAEFPPVKGAWEAIPTTNESYGWHKADRSHKPAAHFIRLAAKAAARGGNLLLNIGPTDTGRFDTADLEILKELALWMEANGDSIHGTTRTPLPVQAWGESTRRDKTLYLHVFHWPADGKVVLGGLRSEIRRAFLLADPQRRPLAVRRLDEQTVSIQGPQKTPHPADSVVVVETDGGEDIGTSNQRLVGITEADTLRAFDGHLSDGLSYGRGKVRDAYVEDWKTGGQSVRWAVRLLEETTFRVAVAYDAEKAWTGGTYAVRLGNHVFGGNVEENDGQAIPLGQITLPPGDFDIVVSDTAIAGEELFRLRGIELHIVAPNMEARAPQSAPNNRGGRLRRSRLGQR